MQRAGNADAGSGWLLAGRYRLVGPLKSGGSGTVWVAADTVLGRDVAIKQVLEPARPKGVDGTAGPAQAAREARAASRVQHPGVVPVHDVVEHDGHMWIVMQLVRAPSLAEVLDERGTLEPRDAARIGLQLLAALRAVHQAGVIHRDVKPSNILVSGDRVQLTDFGIAKVVGEATLSSADLVVGSPSYIAPECIRGEAATPASDLWALGATLYAAVEGRPPIRRNDVMSTLTAAVICDPDPMRRAGPLAPLILALLRRNPDRRPDADDVERRLRRVLELTDELAVPAAVRTGTSVDDHTTSTNLHPLTPLLSEEAPVPQLRQHRARRLFSAAAAAAIVATGLNLLLPGQQAAPQSTHLPTHSAGLAPDTATGDTPAVIDTAATTNPTTAAEPATSSADRAGNPAVHGPTAPNTPDHKTPKRGKPPHAGGPKAKGGKP